MGCYLDYCFCYLCSFVFLKLPLVVGDDYAVVVDGVGGASGGYPWVVVRPVPAPPAPRSKHFAPFRGRVLSEW